MKQDQLTELAGIDRKKMEEFCAYLEFASDGNLDLEALLNSEYGSELLRRLKIRFVIEDDPEQAAAYYETLGLRREIFGGQDYYTHWSLITPLKLEEGERYPVIFWNHGGSNSIECEECMTGFPEVAAREGVLLVLLQNTNSDNVVRVLELLKERYPVDSERVYIGGFSQGATQAQSAYHHHPELFAGCVTSGNDILRPWDNFNVVYTEGELARLKELCVPMIQMVGLCEPSSFVPLNSWKPRVVFPGKPKGEADSCRRPGKHADLDPTRIHLPAVDGKPIWRMADVYKPPKDADIGRWAMERVNRRLELLGCEPREVEKCLSYAGQEGDDLHRLIGIYGDYEAVEQYYGYRHYTVGVNNRAGYEVYRIVAVENSPHWPQLTIGEQGWKFLSQFRRDSRTGALVCGQG